MAASAHAHTRLLDRLRQPLNADAAARAGLWLLTAVTFAVYTWWALALDVHFHTAAFDLGEFGQIVNNYAHFRAPGSTINLKDWQNFYGDHFSPVLALLAPLWWIYPHPQTLLVAQAALVAASVPPVYRFTARRFTPVVALAVAGCYAANWCVQSLVQFQFHEVAFLLPLIAIAIERADAGRFRTAVAATLVMLLVKEDAGVILLGFAVLYATIWRRRRVAAALAAAGVATFLIATQVVIPAASPDRDYRYWKHLYGALSPSLSALPKTLFVHPGRALGLLATPVTKVVLVLRSLLPWLGLPVFSPLFVLAVPLFLERLWALPEAYWSPGFHYNGPVAPVLALAFVDTLHRLVCRLRARFDAGKSFGLTAGQARGAAAVAAAAAVAVTLFGYGDYTPLRAATRPMSLRQTAEEAACYHALAAVPSGVTAEVSDYLAPHLVPRVTVFLPTQALWTPDYLAVSDGVYGGDLSNHDKVQAYLADAQRRGYHQVAFGGSCSVWQAPAR